MRDGRAGWAYTAREDVRRRVGPLCAEECGPVILAQDDDAEYIGAQKATNNTGELTAVYYALARGARTARAGTGVRILSDSKLATYTPLHYTGRWRARRNKALVAVNKAAYEALRRWGVHVSFEHVRAHTGHAMNERADALAKLGAHGARWGRGRDWREEEVPMTLILIGRVCSSPPAAGSSM